MPATAGQFQGSTEHRLSHLSGSGPVFNQLHLTAPFLSAIPVFQHHSAPPFHVTHLYLRRGAILLDLRVGTLLEEEEEEEEEDESRHESKKRAGAILSNNSPEQERNRAAQNAYLKVEKSESVTSMKRSGKTVVLSVTTCNCKALVEFRRLRR